VERTLLIIKPKAVSEGHTGEILARVEADGFHLRAIEKRMLHRVEAETFYAVHHGKSFFEGLITFMCSGPIIAAVIESENAVTKLRNLVGATNPEEAVEGTIRHQFGSTVRMNAVHASDSDEHAKQEIGFFFPKRVLLALCS